VFELSQLTQKPLDVFGDGIYSSPKKVIPLDHLIVTYITVKQNRRLQVTEGRLKQNAERIFRFLNFLFLFASRQKRKPAVATPWWKIIF